MMRHAFADPLLFLHDLPDHELAGRAVSPSSFWSDDVWMLPTTTAGLPPQRLNWRFEILPGELSTDERWRPLLGLAKRLIHTFGTVSQRGRPLKSTSLPSVLTAMKSLMRWMAEHGRTRFSQLDPIACEAYIDHAASSRRDDDGFLLAGFSGHVDLLCRIYEQGPLFGKHPDAVMAEAPFGGLAAHAVMAAMSEVKRPGFIPSMPDPLFAAATGTALEWLGSRADDVIAMQDQLLKAMPRAIRGGKKSGAMHMARAVENFAFDGGGSMTEPWRSPLTPGRILRDARDLVDDTRNACTVSMEALVGVRISEVAGMIAGDLPSGAEWPTTVSVQSSPSGGLELFIFSGRVYKVETREWVAAEWLIGARPAGATYVPPAVRAVTVLWKLYAPWRVLSGRIELLVSFGRQKGFPRGAETIGAIRSRALADGQRAWIEAYVDVPPECVGWHVTTHQWRKGLAQFMVRTDARLLPAIRDHFQHLSAATTERGYVGNDPELLGLIDDAATWEAAKFLFEAAQGKPGAGRLLDTVAANAATILEMAGSDGTDHDRTERLALCLRQDDIRLHDSPWGGCVFRSETARCHSAIAGKPVLWARFPAYMVRQPTICAGCANMIVVDRHLEFWRVRLTSNLAGMQASMLEGEEHAARVSGHRARQAVGLLLRFGVDPSSLPDLSVLDAR